MKYHIRDVDAVPVIKGLLICSRSDHSRTVLSLSEVVLVSSVIAVL